MHEEPAGPNQCTPASHTAQWPPYTPGEAQRPRPLPLAFPLPLALRRILSHGWQARPVALTTVSLIRFYVKPFILSVLTIKAHHFCLMPLSSRILGKG